MKIHVLRFALVSTIVLAVLSAQAADTKTTDKGSVQSDAALAFLNIDIENNPGWVATVKAGYQWKLFRNVGYSISDAAVGNHRTSRNHTTSGLATSVGLGYNFGPRLPLTLGLNFGLGTGGNINTRSTFLSNGSLYSMDARQKIRTYTLDASIDYDFTNCSRWTPFVGVTGGVAFISNRGRANLTNATTGVDYAGSFGKTRRTNLVGGFRTGVKYKINECMTLSLYGSYTYLGSVRGHDFNMANAAGAALNARTLKVKAHEINAKVGLKISF